jgi:hypothetical protein
MALTRGTTWRASPKTRRAISSSTTRVRLRRRCATRNVYYTMPQPGAERWLLPLIPYRMTLVQNIKRDPFEQAVGQQQKSAKSLGGSLGAPMSAWQYDFNILPMDQQLWLEHLETYNKFPRFRRPRATKGNRPAQLLLSLTSMCVLLNTRAGTLLRPAHRACRGTLCTPFRY